MFSAHQLPFEKVSALKNLPQKGANSYRVDPLSEGDQNHFDRVGSLESVFISLKCIKRMAGDNEKFWTMKHHTVIDWSACQSRKF